MDPTQTLSDFFYHLAQGEEDRQNAVDCLLYLQDWLKMGGAFPDVAEAFESYQSSQEEEE